MKNHLKKLLATLIILIMVTVSVPAQSYAVLPVLLDADASPTGISNFVNNTMQRLKSFVLDRLATVIAKQILHQLTMSVVNWINTGFKGSPSFLTNPEAFFLDVGDQVTGAFLATNGPLSSLCSPFAIDIRLSLALSQTQLSDQRYTCTLSKIIEAQKNGPDITINGKVVNSSMNGFLGGDFNQGGWPAFIALTTEPQNNPYDAFLYAKADLNAKIGDKQNTIHADLQLGQGFMSWESCKDIPGQSHVNNQDAIMNGPQNLSSSQDQIMNGPGLSTNSPGVKTVQNKDRTVSYQTCETQTPGSVIAGTLQTSLNSPVVELELANDINAIINALVTQMVSTMLSSGLHALSGSSGGGQAYTQQVITDSISMKNYQGSLDSLHTEISNAIDKVYGYVSVYEQAVSTIKDSQNHYLAAQSCFKARLASPNARMYDPEYLKVKISSIDSKIAIDITPLLSSLNDKLSTAKDDVKKLENMSDSLSGTGSVAEIQDQTNKYTQFVQGGGLIIQPKIDAAQATLSSAQAKAQEFNNDSSSLLNECASTR